MDAEIIKIVASMGGLLVAVVGLWHTVVIIPIRKQLIENNTSIRTLEIDSAKLDTTLNALTHAIERLTDRLDGK